MDSEDLGKRSMGLKPNIAAAFSYSLGWISGFLFIIAEKDNKFVRFHAMQSIVVSVAFSIFQITGWLVLFIIGFLQMGFLVLGISLIVLGIMLGSFIVWIMLMIKAYQGEMFKLPWAGDFSEKRI